MEIFNVVTGQPFPVAELKIKRAHRSDDFRFSAICFALVYKDISSAHMSQKFFICESTLNIWKSTAIRRRGSLFHHINGQKTVNYDQMNDPEELDQSQTNLMVPSAQNSGINEAVEHHYKVRLEAMEKRAIEAENRCRVLQLELEMSQDYVAFLKLKKYSA